MVSYLVRRDRLHALVLAGGTITSVELGAYLPVAETVRRLLSDLDTAADQRLPANSRRSSGPAPTGRRPPSIRR